MRVSIEDYFLHPPAGSAAARAAQFGIDLTLTLGNLRLTPEEPIRKLDSFIEAKRAAGRPKELLALPELEAIQEAQAITTED